MNAWLIAAVTLAYAVVALKYAYDRNYPMALVFAGYAAANCGLIWLDVNARS